MNTNSSVLIDYIDLFHSVQKWNRVQNDSINFSQQHVSSSVLGGDNEHVLPFMEDYSHHHLREPRPRDQFGLLFFSITALENSHTSSVLKHLLSHADQTHEERSLLFFDVI